MSFCFSLMKFSNLTFSSPVTLSGVVQRQRQTKLAEPAALASSKSSTTLSTSDFKFIIVYRLLTLFFLSVVADPRLSKTPAPKNIPAQTTASTHSSSDPSRYCCQGPDVSSSNTSSTTPSPEIQLSPSSWFNGLPAQERHCRPSLPVNPYPPKGTAHSSRLI